jgi:hypothetical protein
VKARIAGTVLAGVAVVSFGLVAPAGAAPPGQWSSKVCTSLSDWSEELARLSADLEPPDDPTPKQVKAALIEFLGEAVDATDALLDDIEAAGTPDVDQGKGVARVFLRGIGRARELFADAEEDARNLPTGSRAKLQARAQAIERALDEGGSEVQGVFNAAETRYDIPALNRAFNNTAACQGLSS